MSAPAVIGHSVRGRPIHAVSVGSGPAALLVHGGIHGDEPGAVAAAERFVIALQQSGGAAGGLPRVVVVPAVNPDGLAGGAKNNARDVDLNRNFPSRSFTTAHRPGYAPGPRPLSEPESAALAALIAAERPARIVALHQPFRCVNWDGPAEALAARVAAACGWPAVADLGYPTPGSFGSCYGVDAGLPVITLELPRPATEEDLAAALAALHAARDP